MVSPFVARDTSVLMKKTPLKEIEMTETRPVNVAQSQFNDMASEHTADMKVQLEKIKSLYDLPPHVEPLFDRLFAHLDIYDRCLRRISKDNDDLYAIIAKRTATTSTE